MPQDRVSGSATSRPSTLPAGSSARLRIADSMLLGGFALVVAIVSVVLVVMSLGKPLDSALGQVAFTMGGSTPGLFLLNMVFSYRDERRGLRQQGRRGLMLSGLAVAVANAPLFLAN